MAKPISLPRWAETVAGVPDTNITEPNEGKKDTGYVVGGDIPTSGGLNWWMRLVYLWTLWLNEATSLATASALVVRDAAGRTKFAAPATTGDAAIYPVNRSQIDAVGQQVSGSSGAFSTTSTTGVDVTGLSVTITTTGRPVALLLQPDGDTVNPSYVGGASAASLLEATMYFLRGATVITRALVGGPVPGTVYVPPGVLSFVDTPTAGTYTYKVQAKSDAGGNTTVYVRRCKLVAYEL
jgi:hypothetical protein